MLESIPRHLRVPGYRFNPEVMVHKFKIHFQGSAYSEELYDERGREIFSLDKAVEEAERQFGPRGWEVFNGQEAENRFIRSRQD